MLAVLRLSLAVLFMSNAVACVAPGSGETALPNRLIGPGGCEGDTPACIVGCSERTVLARAVCGLGVWTCAAGVRHDLCCDPVLAPERCPEWGDTCTPDGACADGYTCVTSRSWPLPADDGVCRLGDWSIPEPLGDCGRDDLLEGRRIFEMGTAAVKLEGIVKVEPVCDGRRCDVNDPCCQQCTGSYVLDLAPPDEPPMLIALRTETLACAGNNCGFTCSPLQPGRRYRIWGLWVPAASSATPGALYVAGSCVD